MSLLAKALVPGATITAPSASLVIQLPYSGGNAQTVNVTSELKGLSGAAYAEIQAGLTSGDYAIVWDVYEEYPTTGLVVPTSSAPAHNLLSLAHTAAENLEHVKAETITVAKSGALYTDPRAAILAANAAASAATPYTVYIEPGIYDVAPFPVSANVKVEGSGWMSTILKSTVASSHFITLGAGALIRNIAIYGPTDFGQACICHAPAGDPRPSTIAEVSISRGYHGILTSPTLTKSTLLVQTLSYAYDASYPAGITTLITATGYASLVCTTVIAQGPPSTIGQAIVVNGANAEALINSSMHGVTNGEAIYVDNGAQCSVLSCKLLYGSNAIHIGPNGSSIVGVLGCIIQHISGTGYTKAIFIESAAAYMSYNGSLTRDKIYNSVGATLFGVITDVKTGSEGITVLGELQLGPDTSRVTPMLEYGLATWLSGLASGGEVSRAGPGSRVVNIALGSGFINDGTYNKKISWAGQSVTIGASAEEFIYIDNTGAAQHSPTAPSYNDNIVIAQAKTNATDVLFLIDDEIAIHHQASRLQVYLENVIGPISQSGIAASINAPPSKKLNVDGGTFLIGLNEHTASPGTAITFTHWYQSAPGVWVAVSGETEINTVKYNNTATGLADVTGGKYKKDSLYVCHSSDGTEYHVVYGQEEFASQIAAEQGASPSAPTIIDKYAMHSAGIVSLAAAAAIASIVDERPHIGQSLTTSGSISDHGALLGLGDDDHAQYLNGVRAAAWHLLLPGAHVTGGDSHDHSGGDGAQIDHTTLANRGTSTHTQIDSHIANTSNPHTTTYAQVGAPPSSLQIIAGAGLTGGGSLSTDRTINIAANADGSITVNSDDIQVGVLASDTQHGSRGGGAQHSNVIPGGASGFITGADKTKLDNTINSFLQWGNDGVGSNTTTRYLTPGYTGSIAPTTTFQFRTPRAGTFSKMYVRQNTPDGNGNAIVYTLRVNGVASSLSVSMASTAYDGSDLVHTVSVAMGDLLDIEVTKAASTLNAPANIIAILEVSA